LLRAREAIIGPRAGRQHQDSRAVLTFFVVAQDRELEYAFAVRHDDLHTVLKANRGCIDAATSSGNFRCELTTESAVSVEAYGEDAVDDSDVVAVDLSASSGNAGVWTKHVPVDEESGDPLFRRLHAWFPFDTLRMHWEPSAAGGGVCTAPSDRVVAGPASAAACDAAGAANGARDVGHDLSGTGTTLTVGGAVHSTVQDSRKLGDGSVATALKNATRGALHMGGAYEFDGLTDFLDLSPGMPKSLSPISVSVWAKPSS
jgi:hypothetical protein